MPIFVVFRRNFDQKPLEVFYKVSLSKSFQRQSCSTINYLSNGINISAGSNPVSVDDLSVCGSVRTCVCRSVCPVHCGKNGGSDPDAVWRRRSDGSRDEAGSAVSGSVHGKGYFLGRIWGRHCNQWGIYEVRVQQRRDAALFPNYFGQTCYYYYYYIIIIYINMLGDLRVRFIETLTTHVWFTGIYPCSV